MTFFLFTKSADLVKKTEAEPKALRRFFVKSAQVIDRSWLLQLHRVLAENRRSKDTMYSPSTIPDLLGPVSADLQKSLDLLLNIAEGLHRLEQELWAQDSQELR